MAAPPSSMSGKVLRDLITAGLDLIFPPHCVACGRSGAAWCSGCEAKVAYLEGPSCRLCGAPLVSSRRACASCLADPQPLIVRSAARYAPPLTSAILAVKYRPLKDLAAGMADRLAQLYQREGWQADTVAPVPLSQERLKRRGFNQAELISRAVAAALGGEHRPELLKRTRRTPSQVGLSPAERAENVRLAFQASEQVRGRRVLLIDDLYTTGATLRACAKAALDVGALQVYGLTVARAC